MEGVHDIQQSETASVVKVSREPAIIINGVSDLPPDREVRGAPVSQVDPRFGEWLEERKVRKCFGDNHYVGEVRGAPVSQVDPRFGEWLEERKVRKCFGDNHYVGEVVKYDSESNWYSVVYEDGDQEDLEWHELEEVLLPLDITIPLKTLVMDKCKLQNAVHNYRPKVGRPGRPRKVYAIMEGTKNKTADMVPTFQGINIGSNQVMFGVVNGQQSSNIPGLLPASSSNDAMSASTSSVPGLLLSSASAGENAQVRLEASNQPKKRGRPRKDRTISGDTQPKKRGRPPKNKNTPGNPQGAESTPSSLALVPAQDIATDMQKAHRRQNSVHRCNAQTAKAEKLKRENLRVKGAPSGTQLF